MNITLPFRFIIYAKKVYSFFVRRDFDFLMLYTNRDCTLDCLYCYGKDQYSTQGDILSLDEYYSVIDQAKSLGARSILFGRVGEPLGNKNVLKLIEYVFKKRMKPVICTNGLFINKEMAQFLYGCNAAVIIKVDSLSPEIQNKLAGKQAYIYRKYKYKYKGVNHVDMIPEGLYCLLKKGFGRNLLWPYKPSVILHAVLSKINKPFFEELLLFSRANKLKIILQPLRYCSSIEKNKDQLLLSSQDYEDINSLANNILGKEFELFQQSQQYFFCIGRRPIIDEYGQLLCFLPSRKVVGNIRKESLSTLWHRRTMMDDYNFALQNRCTCHNLNECPLAYKAMGIS